MPSRNAIGACQDEATGTAREVSTGADSAVREGDKLIVVTVRGKRVLWIPDGVVEMQKRVLVWCHMQEAGHHGVETALT